MLFTIARYVGSSEPRCHSLAEPGQTVQEESAIAVDAFSSDTAGSLSRFGPTGDRRVKDTMAL